MTAHNVRVDPVLYKQIQKVVKSDIHYKSIIHFVEVAVYNLLQQEKAK